MKRLTLVLWVLVIPAVAACGQEPARAEPPAMPQFRPTPNDLIAPPQATQERRITLKLYAPQAKEVRVRGEWPGPDARPWGRGTELTKAEDGVWSATIGPVPPGIYRYSFLVDGLQMADPRNPRSSESLNFVHSLIAVPGLEYQDVQDVPQGAVQSVFFRSKTLGRVRRMHVYTPPGYESGAGRFPVLYLLHGATDSDNSWSTVGHARFILDNLIASGGAKPMIVVMPAGHTAELFHFGDASSVTSGEFEKEFVEDVMPFVEDRYRILKGRQNRAIAGLSMGGMQALSISLEHPERFAYIGVFSSGWLFHPMAQMEKRYAAALSDATARKGLKLFWFATGKEDFLVENSRNTVAALREHGFEVEYDEGEGGHVWENWRAYLHEFAPRLFR